MTRALLAFFALAAIAGCTTTDALYDPGSGPATNGPPGNVSQRTPAGGRIVAAPTVVVPPQPVASFRAGTGVVDSVQQLNVAAPSASAGGSSVPLYRLMLRMDDGTVQTVDQDSRSFRAGDRVRITSDGFVVPQ